MNIAFNLLDEPWLPVRLMNGNVAELGLIEVFKRAGEISALAETAPPSLIAQYRLLLAITHRALGDWKDKDRVNWYRNGLPVETIRDYLERWRNRFWLFHPEYPFMQAPVLAKYAETKGLFPPCIVSLALFYGTEMFNQDVYDVEPWRPAELLRALLGYLQFVPGGFFPGKKLRSSEKAGPLANTAAVLPLGDSLARTLCLCLHPAPTGKVEDLPAWERQSPTLAELQGRPQLASGPNDRYTRQTRAVLLECDERGYIKSLRFAAGLALDEDPNAPDPMASYRMGTNAFVRLTFNEGRTFWRDLPALVPDDSGKNAKPAAVLEYAINLYDQLDSSAYQPLLVAGLASDQAKLLRWRLEQVSLPALLLADVDKADLLRALVGEAESMFGDLRNLGGRMLAETLPDSASKDTRARARSLVGNGPLEAIFFAGGERALARVMKLLAEDQWQQAEACWRIALRESARAAWDLLVGGIGRSPRALRADAKYWPRFHGLLNKHVPITKPDFVKEA